MKADLTRSTFRPDKHYRSVRMQQGRVQLDADWNEQSDIGEYLDETTRRDVIGECGAPEGNAGFGLDVTPDGRDLTLSAGRLYVGGVLCELEGSPATVEVIDGGGATLDSVVLDAHELAPGDWTELSATGVGPFLLRLSGVDAAARAVEFESPLAGADAAALDSAGDIVLRHVTTYRTQPHPHEAMTADVLVDPGTYVAYLDEWARLRTALDDEEIREPALGGPDAAARAQTIWQVRLARLGDVDADVGCADVDLATLAGARDAKLQARPQPGAPPPNPCLLPAEAGYRGLENQLYRVEIHDGGKLGQATFKWSRENGSVVTTWVDQDGTKLTVGSFGRDGNLGFNAGDWVELTDDTHELGGKPGTFARVLTTESPATITIEAPAMPLDIKDFPVNPRVRRWDDPAGLRTVEQPAANDQFLTGEYGIEWRFEGTTFRTGDHWLIAARTGVGIEWADDSAGHALAQPPVGVEHHYCALAIVRWDDGWDVVSDCRKLFPALTELGLEERGIHVVRVRSAQQPLLRNDSQLAIRDLARGIEILCDDAVNPATLDGKPTCLLTLDLPFPTGLGEQPWGTTPVGTVPLTLRGSVTAKAEVIRWLPDNATVAWLDKQLPAGMHGLHLDRVLLHLTLKGKFVSSLRDPLENLDGEAFGHPDDGVLDAVLPSGNGRRGGDLELWFWLTPKELELKQVVIATHAKSRLLNTKLKRKNAPLAIGLAAEPSLLREVLAAGFELDPNAAVDLVKARELLARAKLSQGARLATAVEEPLAPLAQRLNELLHMHDLPLELDIVSVADLSADIRDLVARDQGVDVVVAAADTLDGFGPEQRAVFAEEGRVRL